MHSSVFEISHAPIPMSEPEICLTGSMSRFAIMLRMQTRSSGETPSVSFVGL